MEFWMFEITLILARILRYGKHKKRRFTQRFQLQAIPTRRKEPSGQERGANPAWNFTTTCKIGKQAVEHDGVMLLIELYRSRTFGDQYIGEVRVSFKELFNRKGHFGVV
ncbi:hypothetical protein CK203_108884 [Vitis vinifera]|uniref:C2 domain-containing protein n=1 Tax=Vitis vinifera TaxID=29760 RepID=A0A438CST1_VITVI|nr:hypothetical protein CK203_108884 [Vitis vinifera]